MKKEDLKLKEEYMDIPKLVLGTLGGFGAAGLALCGLGKYTRGKRGIVKLAMTLGVGAFAGLAESLASYEINTTLDSTVEAWNTILDHVIIEDLDEEETPEKAVEE